MSVCVSLCDTVLLCFSKVTDFKHIMTKLPILNSSTETSNDGEIGARTTRSFNVTTTSVQFVEEIKI